MSYSKLVLISAILASVEARFGQEQVPVAAVSSLQAGNPGQAATLAGSVPGVLLAAADPCAKLKLADQIAALGTGADVLEAAKGVVAAEQNFNPFAVSVPNICGDASLPATEALRGIVPLVDPAVGGSDTENANSKASLTTPFDATGLSVADIMKAQGFSNFTVKGAAAGGAAGGNANTGNNNQDNNKNNDQNNDQKNNNANTGNANNNQDSAADDCNGGATAGDAASGNTQNQDQNNKNNNNDKNNKDNNNNNNNNNNADTGNNNADTGNNNADTGNNAGAGAAAGGAADFGKCTPTIDFQLGRPGRKATEGTFLPTDPLVAKGQQDALNPNIITNRVCDQLTNVCGANAAAKALCKDAQAQISASGDKSADVATKFNSLLGF